MGSLAELAVIFLVALFVIKPEKVPSLLRKMGRWIHGIRNLAARAEQTIENEMKLDNLKDNEERAAKADGQYNKNNHD